MISMSTSTSLYPFIVIVIVSECHLYRMYWLYPMNECMIGPTSESLIFSDLRAPRLGTTEYIRIIKHNYCSKYFFDRGRRKHIGNPRHVIAAKLKLRQNIKIPIVVPHTQFVTQRTTSSEELPAISFTTTSSHFLFTRLISVG